MRETRGARLLLGTATARDDWRCSQCQAGRYAPGPRAVAWGQDATTGVWSTADPSVEECSAKGKARPPPCDPDVAFYAQGTSATADDWGCQPYPMHVSMCARAYKTDTRSGLAGVQVGMPELVSPFTTADAMSLMICSRSGNYAAVSSVR